MDTKANIEDMLSRKSISYNNDMFEVKNMSDYESHMWVLQMMRLVSGKENQPMMEFINDLYLSKDKTNIKKRTLVK